MGLPRKEKDVLVDLAKKMPELIEMYVAFLKRQNTQVCSRKSLSRFIDDLVHTGLFASRRNDGGVYEVSAGLAIPSIVYSMVSGKTPRVSDTCQETAQEAIDLACWVRIYLTLFKMILN